MLHTAAGLKNPYLRFLLRASHISSQTEAVAAAKTSNCISQAVAAVHFWRLLHKAFAMVTSFLSTAVMMTLCGFPALRRRSAKDFGLGL